ncbi:MAG: DNA/RNA non-specific endonuclease [Treponema sp.]|nr:DNA/RNA non-specific endonuclease [Treponema sp.]
MATKNINTAGDSGTVKKSSNTAEKAKSETKSETKKTSTTKTVAKTETKSKSETKSVAATKTATKAETASKAKTEPAGKAKAESSSKSETKSEAASKTEVKSKSTTKAEPAAKAKTEAAPKSEAKTKSSSKPEQKKPAAEKKEAKPEQKKSVVKTEVKAKSTTKTEPAAKIKTESTSKSDAKKTSVEKKTPAQTESQHKKVDENVKEQVDEVEKEAEEENQKEIKINFTAAEAVEKAEKAMSAIEEYVPESAKPKFSKVKKIVIAAVSGFVVLLSAAWFFCGKPIVEIGAEGFTVYPTEDPILYHIPEYLSGEYPPETNYGEINGTGGVFNTSIVLSQGKITLSGDIIRDKSTQPASDGAYSEKPSSKSGSGIKGSNPKADSGHAENSPLYFGNPTDSMSDSEMYANYLMVKDQYTVSYNTRTLCPNWVAWHLDKSNMGPADRCDDFRPDEDLPEAWYGVKKADYQYNKYGFDRGHVCPSADRTATKLDNSMTFLMTNMVPQSPDNNRVIWMHFENYERELVNKGNEVYIIAGPYGTGGTSQKGTFDEIPITLKSKEVLHMNVPAYTWKVLIALPDGEDDVSRIGEEAIVIAINVPNRMGMGKTGDWEQYICSVDEIEDLTGYDFFELLPDDIEDVLESREYVYTK